MPLFGARSWGLSVDTYVMFISMLTPGIPASVQSRAIVDMLSTSVAVKPPWRVPILLVCSSSIFISQTTFPGAAETSVTYGRTQNKAL